MNDKEKKAIEKIEKQILIGECEKSIGVPIYISDLKIVLNLIENQEEVIKILNEGIKRQNKQIDLMAEQLAGLTIFDIDKEEPLILKDKEEVKEYFEKKAEEE